MKKPLYTVRKSILAALRLRLFIAFLVTCAIGVGIFFLSGSLSASDNGAETVVQTENVEAEAGADNLPEESEPEVQPEESKAKSGPEWLPEKLRENFLIVRIALAALLPAIVLLIQLALIIRVMSFKIQIYENRIVVKEGILFATMEQQWCFTGVARFIIARTFWSHVFGIAEILIICPGGLRINERFIRRPNRLKRFLSAYFIGRKSSTVHFLND